MKEKTGRNLEEWTAFLDQQGFRETPHREIAAFLREHAGLSPWWSQQVTVEYEKATGRRITGQTEKTGFQLGVSRTLNTPARILWDWLVSESGVTWFAGALSEDFFTQEGVLTSSGGIMSELKVFKKDSHLRLRWKFPEWRGFSTLQIRITPKGEDRTTLSIHQEKLSSQMVRTEMLAYWKQKIDNLPR